MVMAAPNGARRTRADHPALPVSPRELAQSAAALLGLGVSVFHLHVRDSDGRHTLAGAAYREAIAAIERKVGSELVLQVTTEAAGRYDSAQQMALVRELQPEAVSLALRELCPDPSAEASAASFFAWLHRERIWPQYILHSAEDLERFEAMRRRGLFLEEHPSCLLVLGRYAGGAAGDPAQLHALLSSVDPGAFSWSACCFGPHEFETMLAAHDAGGHVRLGFENNMLLADGSTARDNAALVAQFMAGIRGSKRLPATADEVRSAFNLKGRE